MAVCEHPSCRTPQSPVKRRPNIRWVKTPRLCHVCYLATLQGPTRLIERGLDPSARSVSVLDATTISDHMDRSTTPDAKMRWRAGGSLGQ